MTAAQSVAAQLAAYLGAPGSPPFSWERRHCGHFTGAWVLQATGRDVLRTLPPLEGPLAWAREIHRAGGWVALVSRCLLASPVAPSFAQVGDVVLLPGEMTGGTLGLCVGTHVACLADDGSLVYSPVAEAIAAWHLREVSA